MNQTLDELSASLLEEKSLELKIKKADLMIRWAGPNVPLWKSCETRIKRIWVQGASQCYQSLMSNGLVIDRFDLIPPDQNSIHSPESEMEPLFRIWIEHIQKEMNVEVEKTIKAMTSIETQEILDQNTQSLRYFQDFLFNQFHLEMALFYTCVTRGREDLNLFIKKHWPEFQRTSIEYFNEVQHETWEDFAKILENYYTGIFNQIRSHLNECLTSDDWETSDEMGSILKSTASDGETSFEQDTSAFDSENDQFKNALENHKMFEYYFNHYIKRIYALIKKECDAFFEKINPLLQEDLPLITAPADSTSSETENPISFLIDPKALALETPNNEVPKGVMLDPKGFVLESQDCKPLLPSQNYKPLTNDLIDSTWLALASQKKYLLNEPIPPYCPLIFSKGLLDIFSPRSNEVARASSDLSNRSNHSKASSDSNSNASSGSMDLLGSTASSDPNFTLTPMKKPN